jgi:predicted AlkP superfamily pyrophosphatase or phosphodiesterase
MTRLLIAILALLSLAAPAAAAPVLMISIDGLRPADVVEAEARGLKLPHLQRFVREGSYATGVIGVVPTVTYPSHTTLITGAAPARHGIVGNLTFDPLLINQGGWMWYATDIKVPTLWEAASRAGIKVGNVHWPVSVGAKGVAWNLPQIWRTGHGDDAKLLTILATPGLVGQLEAATGDAYPMGIDETIEGDERRGRFAEALIRKHRPGFLTVYFAGLDHEQHDNGADTPPARAGLERLDAVVGKLVTTYLAIEPGGVVALVSDHGFAPVSRRTDLFHAFIDEGLIRLDEKGKIKTWEAMPDSEGGSAAVMLARPDDAALKARVAALLARLKADPESGISQILDRAETDRVGGNPAASFYIGFEPGASAGSFEGPESPLYKRFPAVGTHGYLPSEPMMRSTFMLLGKGIARGKSLGVIDMRAIAPTLAKIMGTRMEQAEVPALVF